ncbi:hypothetical protein QBC45DRAFT_429880 [Copromyces sp. CBS 386.78]|nr:hypothetical protein QBC45DRAFT_429880 [Copromyces sp. CBS 386.78]
MQYNHGGNPSDSSLRKSGININNSNNISGGPNNNNFRKLGKGSGFGYRETGGGFRSGKFNYPGFNYPGGLSSPSGPNYPSGPNGPNGPNNPGNPSGLSNPNSPYPPTTILTPILYYYRKVFYRNLERFKEFGDS